ncbi:MAG: TetR/AcrR family transcriptional regulator [Oscillospiraceae bacterium]|nr:TetR/AcrR family transcriptional regulator [Oscillospiraceae bacterium]
MSGRFDVFHSLDPEKQKRIIDAALDEFAVKGFKRASTNAIAENAQIGKGMLFYYFGNKEELFDFLCQYAIAFAKDKYLRTHELDTNDFLLRYQRLTEIKRKTIAEHPKFAAFFESFYQDWSAESLEKYMAETTEIRSRIIAELTDGIDYSLFRDDMDGEHIVKYITWLFDSYSQEVTDRFRSGELTVDSEDVITAEWTRYDSFIKDLRKLFYK